MTSAGLPRDSDQRRPLVDRLSFAVARAKATILRYVQIRQECELTVGETRKLRSAAQDLREELRSLVTAYVSVLRTNGDPKERVVRLVKDVADDSGLALSLDEHLALREDVVRWALDANHAA